MKKISIEKKYVIMIAVQAAIIAFCILTDLLFKHYMEQYFLNGGKNLTIIPYIVNLTYTTNTGAAFGFLAGNVVLLAIISTVFLAAFVYFNFMFKSTSAWYIIGYGLVFGGAVGNLADRIFITYVRDFFQFAFWKSFPIFNFADIFLTLGIACLSVHFLREILKEMKSKGNAKKF